MALDYGIKISKDGYDVKTSDIKDLVMTSKANQWKIHAQGTISFSGSGYLTVEHNLGYTPSYLGMYHSVSWDLDRYTIPSISRLFIDSTYIHAYGSSSGDIISYVIFKDFGA